jgi:hypothetical protein
MTGLGRSAFTVGLSRVRQMIQTNQKTQSVQVAQDEHERG